NAGMPRESLPGLRLRDGLVHKRAGSQEIGVEASNAGTRRRISAFSPRTIRERQCAESCVMTAKRVSNPNPKMDPASNSNTEKEPDDWVSGNDPMTGAQASYLKTFSEECGEPEVFQPRLTKAEASKRIDAPKAKRQPVRHR